MSTLPSTTLLEKPRLFSAERLSANPDRGSFPKELSALGIREYRQVFYKPYRIIYSVSRKRVYIYPIADGRCDFQTLLARRLLGS
jgi:toxin ParE1/3/4